jgi:hypothetical protein
MLLRRLTERLDVLADGADDLPERQRTLRTTIDWSYQLLNPAEQAVFTRISVFAGDTTLDAIEGTCGDHTIPDVLDTVSSLAEKSLVTTSTPDPDGVPRIAMLQTIRKRARELLAQRGETEAVTARYIHWYADFCEPADVLTHNRAPRYWPALEPEIANLHAVAQWANAHADSGLLVSLARRLWPWLWTSGRVGQMQEAVSEALAALPPDAAPQHIGYLRYVAAYAHGLTGDFTGALQLVNQALREYETAGDAASVLLVAAARLVRGTLTMGLGGSDRVGEDFDHAVQVARENGNAWLLGYATSHRGLRRAMHGDLAGARTDHDQSLAVAIRTGNDALAAQAIGQLALVDVLERRLHRARLTLRAQVTRLKRTGNQEGLANALDTAAALAVAHEQWETAARAAMSAQHLRDRVRLAAWPLIREYHSKSQDAARRAVGERVTEIEADARETDPWKIIDRALADTPDSRTVTRLSFVGAAGPAAESSHGVGDA